MKDVDQRTEQRGPYSERLGRVQARKANIEEDKIAVAATDAARWKKENMVEKQSCVLFKRHNEMMRPIHRVQN